MVIFLAYLVPGLLCLMNRCIIRYTCPVRLDMLTHLGSYLSHSHSSDELRQVTVCKLSYQHFCYQGEHSTESQDRKHKNGWRSEPRGRCVRYRLLRSHLENCEQEGRKGGGG